MIKKYDDFLIILCYYGFRMLGGKDYERCSIPNRDR